MTLEEWLEEVDTLLISSVGISYLDLPDRCWADEWENDMKPKESARECLLENGMHPRDIGEF